jgi:hypothetical protein
MSETPSTSGLHSGAPRRRKKASASGILVYLPSIEKDGWKDVDVRVTTGLAAIGSPVCAVVPDNFPFTDIFLGDVCVVGPNLVRLHFSNNSLSRTRPLEFLVQLLPYEKRKSMFPELTFDIPEM